MDIYFVENKTGDEGANALAEALQVHTSLQELNLCGM